MKTQEHPQAELLRAIADGKQMQWRTLAGEWMDFKEGRDLPPLQVIVRAAAEIGKGVK